MLNAAMLIVLFWSPWGAFAIAAHSSATALAV